MIRQLTQSFLRYTDMPNWRVFQCLRRYYQREWCDTSRTLCCFIVPMPIDGELVRVPVDVVHVERLEEQWPFPPRLVEFYEVSFADGFTLPPSVYVDKWVYPKDTGGVNDVLTAFVSAMYLGRNYFVDRRSFSWRN